MTIVRQINLGDLLWSFGPDDLHEEIVEHIHADVGVAQVGGLEFGYCRPKQIRIHFGEIVSRKI